MAVKLADKMVHIVTGLPGSGRTEFAKKLSREGGLILLSDISFRHDFPKPELCSAMMMAAGSCLLREGYSLMIDDLGCNSPETRQNWYLMAEHNFSAKSIVHDFYIDEWRESERRYKETDYYDPHLFGDVFEGSFYCYVRPNAKEYMDTFFIRDVNGDVLIRHKGQMGEYRNRDKDDLDDEDELTTQSILKKWENVTAARQKAYEEGREASREDKAVCPYPDEKVTS